MIKLLEFTMNATSIANLSHHKSSEEMLINNTYWSDNNTAFCLEFCGTEQCSIVELEACVNKFIQPTKAEWLFISLHLLIFVVGVLGNFLVCLVVLRSRHMQTVTNLFISNLAVADLIVLVFSSPPSVLQTVTETWWLGETMCKITHFIQVRPGTACCIFRRQRLINSCETT